MVLPTAVLVATLRHIFCCVQHPYSRMSSEKDPQLHEHTPSIRIVWSQMSQCTLCEVPLVSVGFNLHALDETALRTWDKRL